MTAQAHEGPRLGQQPVHLQDGRVAQTGSCDVPHTPALLQLVAPDDRPVMSHVNTGGLRWLVQ
ncbi:MAG: hypothetical protein JWO27_1293 [Frankiales bacterium]|jgi:hypothetical protein|nr:hypothetical protein [Frankiales bacterium]MCW2706701.1 hypothetical protein [Frankiales bacterium]